MIIAFLFFFFFLHLSMKGHYKVFGADVRVHVCVLHMCHSRWSGWSLVVLSSAFLGAGRIFLYFVGSYSYISIFLAHPSGWTARLTKACCAVDMNVRASVCECVRTCLCSLIKSAVVSKDWPFKSSGWTKHIFAQEIWNTEVYGMLCVFFFFFLHVCA